MMGNAGNASGIGRVIVLRRCGHGLIGSAKAEANAIKNAAKK
jgi:hypothetical protein